jgi:hypothetical protein
MREREGKRERLGSHMFTWTKFHYHLLIAPLGDHTFHTWAFEGYLSKSWYVLSTSVRKALSSAAVLSKLPELSLCS